MTDLDDKELDAALARVLGPEAGDTAPLSRAVLTRIAEQSQRRPASLAEVLALPLPASGLMLAALILFGAIGYSLLPGEVEETLLLQFLIGG